MTAAKRTHYQNLRLVAESTESFHLTAPDEVEVLLRINTPEEVDTLLGAGSARALRCRKALALYGGPIEIVTNKVAPYTYGAEAPPAADCGPSFVRGSGPVEVEMINDGWIFKP